MGAMNEVMDSFHKNSTWNNWYYIRKESSLLDIKWVFIMKMILFIRKSQIQSQVSDKRLCSQNGISYNEEFSIVVKYSSIQILLVLIAQYDVKLVQLDVKTTCMVI